MRVGRWATEEGKGEGEAPGAECSRQSWFRACPGACQRRCFVPMHNPAHLSTGPRCCRARCPAAPCPTQWRCRGSSRGACLWATCKSVRSCKGRWVQARGCPRGLSNQPQIQLRLPPLLGALCLPCLLCPLRAPADLAALSVRLPHVRPGLPLGIRDAVAQVGALRVVQGSTRGS